MKRLIKAHKPEIIQDLKTGTLTVRPLKNVKYTGQRMRELAVLYQNDVAMHGHLSFMQFYDLIKNLPYKNDPKKQEFLQRPYYTLTQRGQGGDCDDKCICIGAYCAIAKFPFRFVACGKMENGRLHHVITEVLMDNDKGVKSWIHVDATYAYNTIGKQIHRYPKHLVISDSYPKLKGTYPLTLNSEGALS